MESETICHYYKPGGLAVFNAGFIFRGEHTEHGGVSYPAITPVVKGLPHDRIIWGLDEGGIDATKPDELKRAVDAVVNSYKPTLIKAIIGWAADSTNGNNGNPHPEGALTKQG